MLIDAQSQLAYIKIGIVITVVWDINNYPNTNPATTFQYAGVYMNYTLFNTAQPIIRTDPIAAGGQNFNYFTLLTARYQIYGLSSFYIRKVPADMTVLNYDLTLAGSSTVLFQTDNVNYMTLVRVSADQWANVPTAVCNPTATVMRHIVEKYMSTVPTMQNNQQNIYETSSELQFNYFAEGSYTEDAAAPLSATVVFSNILYFEQISVGSAYKIDFSVSLDTTLAAFTGGFNMAGGTTVQLQYSIKVEGNEILSKVEDIVAGSVHTGANAFAHPLGFVFTTTTPTI